MQKVIAVVKDADGVEHRLSVYQSEAEGLFSFGQDGATMSFSERDIVRIERPLRLPQNLGAVIRVTWPDEDEPTRLVRTGTTERSSWFDPGLVEIYSEGNISEWVIDGATVEVLHEGWVQP